MFPEIRSALKRWFEPEPSPSIAREIARETKAGGGFAFDAVNAAWYLRNGYPGIYSILTGGMPAWSGEYVSVDTALNHSVVWACNRVISESIRIHSGDHEATEWDRAPGGRKSPDVRGVPGRAQLRAHLPEIPGIADHPLRARG